MKKTFLFSLLFFATNTFAQVDFKQVASDMSVMTRTMDRLMAKQEMKESLAMSVLQKAVHQPQFFAEREVSHKIALLTDDDTLKNCQSNYHEDRSSDGQKVDALVQYEGANCPIAIKATIHMNVINGNGDGDVNLQIDIVSEKLKAEMDITQFNMPMKIQIQAAPADNGFAMNMLMKIGAKGLSQKYGTVQYDTDINSQLVFGQEMKMTATTTETFSSGSQKTSFVQVSETGNAGQKETFSIDGVVVSKEDFQKQHGAVALPGFDDKQTPLEKVHTCALNAYDANTYSLAQVRQSIKENTVDSLKVADRLMPMTLAQTGKLKSQVQLGGQALALNVDVTADAARFSFAKFKNGQEDEEIGRLTAVLGDRVDLSRQIDNRIVLITCQPQ